MGKNMAMVPCLASLLGRNPEMTDVITVVTPFLDCLLKITDLVPSCLSPAALDVARYTCKAWHQHIKRNSWVLSSVLDKSGETVLRGLLKGLDRGSDLLSTH